ncbi:TetR/AcrR family transcriptional regulator [Pseudomonas sp. No.21]|uniref:TetR/AcrR family transcriptional regulator n=1 Tax=Pseudomonas TaxID=286 RepID=UPI000DA84E5B|nr:MULTISPECIES: TetR/AcrR family transcriptional regulator [Pseudomonas]MDW3716223.1 TetR/AcrR family transcriptional regulator [Pseudomonas sp. 2023EL-01195]PZE10279.1 TetR/AcrR family transcriptional regulator [Pseudomonas sp. 57B-090624]GJN48500.1 TetR family transcriptional regulator [Pseudomonas tohonis]
MRYSPTHKEETRQKLLESSGAIAKAGGFSSTGVDALMKAIGLTGGAFYSHFPSKDDLFTAIVERELSRSLIGQVAQGEGFDQARLQRCLEHYLSMAHVRNAEGGCAIPALGAEIARAGLPVRETAEHWMLQLQQAWAEILEDGELAWAVISQCVGALVIARMLASEPLQEEVLGAGRQLLMQALERRGQGYPQPL